MDISHTLAPNSDQLDAVDLLGGPRTFTIEKVTPGNPEQPVNVHLAEFDRPWRPGKSMRRVLAAAWGADASIYAGRRVTLFCDTRVKFGGEEVGGTRIQAMSHIDKPLKVSLLVSHGKAALFTVQPLADAPPPAAPKPDLAGLTAAFEEVGIDDREQRVNYCRKHVGRGLSSATDLTADECAGVIDALKSDAADMAAAEAGGE